MSYLYHQFDAETPPATDRYPEWRFRASFEHAPVGMAHVAPDGRFLLVNDQFCAIAGHSCEALLRDGFQNITHPDDLTSDLAHVRSLLEGKRDRYTMEKRYIRNDGETVWINLTVSLIRDEQGLPDFFIAVIEDLSDIKRAQAEAIIDPLTGILNRRGLIERLEEEIALAATSGSTFGVLYIDLDGFKTVNDRLGHAVGDECLRCVGISLADHGGPESLSGRIGGDEFVMILPGADREQLTDIGEQIRQSISDLGTANAWSITASLGAVRPLALGHTTPQSIIDQADRAMYIAKRAGKNRLHVL